MGQKWWLLQQKENKRFLPFRVTEIFTANITGRTLLWARPEEETGIWPSCSEDINHKWKACRQRSHTLIWKQTYNNSDNDQTSGLMWENSLTQHENRQLSQVAGDVGMTMAACTQGHLPRRLHTGAESGAAHGRGPFFKTTRTYRSRVDLPLREALPWQPPRPPGTPSLPASHIHANASVCSCHTKASVPGPLWPKSHSYLFNGLEGKWVDLKVGFCLFFVFVSVFLSSSFLFS